MCVCVCVCVCLCVSVYMRQDLNTVAPPQEGWGGEGIDIDDAGNQQA